MIDVFWCDISQIPDPAEDGSLLGMLPEGRRREILRPVRAETRRERAAEGMLLSQALSARGADPAKIFVREDGKPCHPDLFFNLSHSGGGVALALSEEGEVGCDTERLRPVPMCVERAFFPAEKRYLEGAEDRALAFFRLWTGKESYLKMTGEGLKGLRSVEVSPERGEVRRAGILQACRLREYRVGDFLITVCTERGEFAKNVRILSLR